MPCPCLVFELCGFRRQNLARIPADLQPLEESAKVPVRFVAIGLGRFDDAEQRRATQAAGEQAVLAGQYKGPAAGWKWPGTCGTLPYSVSSATTSGTPFTLSSSPRGALQMQDPPPLVSGLHRPSAPACPAEGHTPCAATGCTLPGDAEVGGITPAIRSDASRDVP